MTKNPTPIKPGDDFYNYVNQVWIDDNPIPDNKSRVSAFDVLHDENTERLRTLLQAPADDDSYNVRLAKQFYESAMDVDALPANDNPALQPILQSIGAIDHSDKVIEYITKEHAAGRSLLWSTSIDVDDKDSERYIVRIAQSGLGLPDRDYYLENGEKFESVKSAYKYFLCKLFELLGHKNAEIRAEHVISLETKLAKQSQTAVERRDDEANYNLYSIDELDNSFPCMKWGKYFERIGFARKPSHCIVAQPKFLAHAIELIGSSDIDAVKDYLIIRSITPYLSTLSEQYDELSFSFYGTILSGAKEQEPRYRRIIGQLINKLPEPVGELFVSHHFDPNAKSEITKLVDYVGAALEARISQLDWMSEQTKQRAYAKLNTFMPLLGYPDDWRDYSQLSLTGSYFDMVRAINTFEWHHDVGRIDDPVDRKQWLMSPAMVNAYYWPNTNGITFPAGILQPPFFDATGDFAANFGAIGVVIGHEMSHGFDDQGSKFDEIGNLKSWWTKADRQAFEDRAKKLKEQFDTYEIDGRHVNGALTLGENIGDLGGTLVAYDAMQAYIKDNNAYNSNDGKTPEQRFFISLATVWRHNMRPELRLRYLVTDPHAPAELRVNGVVPNIDSFYTAFDVTEGGNLYKSPDERVRIW